MNWFWQGLIPNNIRPGQAFQIIITASGFITIKGEPEPEFEDVDGQAIANVVLENVLPSLSVTQFQSTLAVTQPTHTLRITGSTFEPGGAPYGITKLQYQLGAGPRTNISMDANGAFILDLTLPPGSYLLTIEAADNFASVDTFQQTLWLYQYQPPAVPDPTTLRKTPSGFPASSSITTWTRLEPQVAKADIGVASNARVFDPLWLMTRQWQVGEFQGEDTGSPVQARLRATNARLTRALFGEPSDKNNVAKPYDPSRAPLETLVERRRMRASSETDARMLTLAVEAGLHFLRMVELDATAKKYRPAFLATYLLQAPVSPPAVADDNALRFVQTMIGRAPDARRLATAFRHPGAAQISFDPALNIATADVAAVQGVATAWLAWYGTLFAEPVAATDDAWTASRLEYAVSTAARLSAAPEDSLTFSTNEFDGGTLDWSSFDVDNTHVLNTTGDHTFVPLNETTVPSPVTFPGAPAPRFWELEDAKIAYGLLSAGPTDLAHLMMIEYSGSYGNDWYIVPMTTPVGSVTRVDSLVVTDTFGVRSLVRPIGDPALGNPFFSMWQHTTRRYAGDELGAPVPNRFFLPPTIGRALDGPSVEEVLFMRDEMSNVAWGIERSIEGAIELPVSLSSGTASQTLAPAPVVAPPAPGAPPRYQLATSVPPNWIPLLPVEQQVGSALLSRLKRAAVLQPDGKNIVHRSLSETLGALGSNLLYDEEVPREGVRITRRRRMTRWVDGSSWVWTAFRNEVGRGEGSAGLVYDSLVGEDGVQP